MISIIISLVVGFVAGAVTGFLVGRKNPKHVEAAVSAVKSAEATVVSAAKKL